jgi:glycosyltransferase involved in cell wall biosynthesis
MNLENKYVIGFVGRLSKEKNISRLIEIFKKIKDDKAILFLVGEGPEKEKLLEQARELGDRVIFLGRREDVGNLMSSMDVFVMTSLFEGLPVVLVEAQTSGLRCVISDRIPEINLIGNLEIVKLEDPDEVWLDRIMYKSEKNRNNVKDQIQKCGYDINLEVQKLEKFYLDNFQENVG